MRSKNRVSGFDFFSHWVAVNSHMAEKLRHWSQFLTTVAAVSAANGVLGREVPRVASVLTLTCDACKLGEGTPGLGAYLHGQYCRVPLCGTNIYSEARAAWHA